MEDFVFRFPLVGRHIINKLDNLGVTKAKQVSGTLFFLLSIYNEVQTNRLGLNGLQTGPSFTPL